MGDQIQLSSGKDELKDLFLLFGIVVTLAAHALATENGEQSPSVGAEAALVRTARNAEPGKKKKALKKKEKKAKKGKKALKKKEKKGKKGKKALKKKGKKALKKKGKKALKKKGK